MIAIAPLLDVADLVVRYDRVEAVRGVSLVIARGESMCVVGPNGAGKTSLVRAIAGLERSASGTVRFKQDAIERAPLHKRIRAGIVYVPEGTQVFPSLTVEENLQVPLIAAGRRGDAAAFARVFEIFPVLADRRTQDAGTLSGGENRMLAVARALVLEPELLIVDEPSLGLSPRATEVLANALRELAAADQTVLVSEQGLACASAIGGAACLMVRGELTWHGRAEGLAEVDQVRAAVLGRGLT